MRKNKLRAEHNNAAIINGWLAIPSSYSAEILGHQGYDAVTVDLQHGMIDFASALSMLQALSATPAVPLVRVADNDPAQIMRMLDAGAYGIICLPDDLPPGRGPTLCRRLPLPAAGQPLFWSGTRLAVRRGRLPAARQ